MGVLRKVEVCCEKTRSLVWGLKVRVKKKGQDKCRTFLRQIKQTAQCSTYSGVV